MFITRGMYKNVNIFDEIAFINKNLFKLKFQNFNITNRGSYLVYKLLLKTSCLLELV